MTLVQYREPEHDGEPPRGWIALMTPAVELAKAVAATEFVPKAFRNNPAPIAAAILYGDEVGLGPMQSLAKIAVIEGRPSLAAEAQRALILAAGHSLWLTESSATRCTWTGKRRDDDVTSSVTWTMDDARRAGLAGKPSWRAYPRQMLSARASAELARAIFADVIGGLIATEELEDGTVEDDVVREVGAAATGPRVAQPPRGTRRRRRPAPAAVATTSGGSAAPAASSLPPLPGEDAQPTMSDAQRRRMMALFRDRNVSDRNARLAYAAKVVGRDLSSSKDLTADEAAAVIADLESWDPDVDESASGADADTDVVDGEVVEEEPTVQPEGGDE